MRYSVLFATTLSCLLAVAAARADAAQGFDEVTLKNGGSVRGTVVSSEPGTSVKVIELGQTAVRTIPWSEVSDVERGKYAPEKAPAQPGPAGPGYGSAPPVAAAPPPPPAPKLGASGVVRLHVESPKPVAVFEHPAPMVAMVNGYTVVIDQSHRVCSSPCDVVVDGSAGQRYTAGGDFPETAPFTLDQMKGDVDLKVKPGNRATRALGVLGTTLGGVGVITGGTLLIIGAMSKPTIVGGLRHGFVASSSASSLAPIGGVTLGVSAAALVGGIVLLVNSGSHFDLRENGAPKPDVARTTLGRLASGRF